MREQIYNFAKRRFYNVHVLIVKKNILCSFSKVKCLAWGKNIILQFYSLFSLRCNNFLNITTLNFSVTFTNILNAFLLIL